VLNLFLSTFTNKVDRKGRVSVPATFRAALASQSFAGIVCFPSFTSSCLEGMGIDRLETLSAGMDQFDAFSAEQDDMARLVFAQSRQLAWDPEGRIMLPEDFLQFSGITTHAAFVGMGKTFQIWEPGALDAAMRAARERAAEKRPTLRVPASTGGAE
jgi:MraZ protein